MENGKWKKATVKGQELAGGSFDSAQDDRSLFVAGYKMKEKQSS